MRALSAAMTWLAWCSVWLPACGSGRGGAGPADSGGGDAATTPDAVEDVSVQDDGEDGTSAPDESPRPDGSASPDDAGGNGTVKPGVDPERFTVCHGQDPVATARPATLAYHNGQPLYHVSVSGHPMQAGDREAVQFRPLHPFRLERVVLRFFGGPGSGTVRLVGDFGGSQPDEGLDLVTPRPVQVADASKPVVLDLSGEGLVLPPLAKFWVVFVHGDASLFLALDNGQDPGDDSHSMYWIATLIEQWKQEGQAFTWGGMQGNDYGVEVEGEYYCPEQDPAFVDRTAEVASLAGRKAGRILVGDVDGDGWDDLFAILGNNPVDPDTGKVATGGQTLLRNGGGWAFTDITDASGLVGTGVTQAQFGDVDNDGDADVFGGVNVNVSSPETDNGRRSTVFLNDGLGRFSAVNPSGLEYEAPVAAAAFLDVDRDGFLDLYLGAWLLKYPNPAAAPDRLYRGNGDGTFTDVTALAGLPVESFKALPCYGVVPGDYNADGLTDLFVANYGYSPDALWRNRGDGTFVNVAKQAGLNYMARTPDDGSGGNGFGGDFGDYDNDGDLDLFVANIAHPRYQPWSDRSHLSRNGGGPDPVFEDVTDAAGIVYDEGDIDGTFLDADNDGFLDLFTCPVYPHHYARLYRNHRDGTFSDITYFAGISVHECQSVTFGDLDRDGDLDLLVTSRRDGGVPFVYENRIGQDHRFVAFSLRGTWSNRSALGARVTVTAGGMSQVREVRAGKGHNGMASTLVQHFGLGLADRVDRVEVRWPSGKTQTVGPLAADRFYRVTEGSDAIEELP